ncbi:MAG TPA: hypothetical protein VFM41_05635 [Gaiella sp.]|nr:hypothetical protein [Gaiella sp.]
MSKHLAPNGRRPAAKYRIVVAGALGPRFREAFSDFEITSDGDDTALEGDVVDQAQLQGILDRVGSLNLTLVSVAKLD